jgi:hypothetical protein
MSTPPLLCSFIEGNPVRMATIMAKKERKKATPHHGNGYFVSLLSVSAEFCHSHVQISYQIKPLSKSEIKPKILNDMGSQTPILILISH